MPSGNIACIRVMPSGNIVMVAAVIKVQNGLLRLKSHDDHCNGITFEPCDICTN